MENLNQTDIKQILEDFLEEGREITHRYKSFDFCYSHFYFSKFHNQVDIEKSCYVLWSYLASWGMLRGSSFLLNKNPAYLSDLVDFIYKQDMSVWKIDIDNYNENNIKTILEIYKEIKNKILLNEKIAHTTLITKIMLGVFGIIPAYDRYFCETFKSLSECGFTSVNEKSLTIIHQFYQDNKETIDDFSQKTFIFDFNNNKTNLKYTKAKIIDMYGFTKSFKK